MQAWSLIPTLAVGGLLVTWCLSGCASITPGEPRTQQRNVGSRVVEADGKKVRASVEQDGTLVEVRLTRLCGTRQVSKLKVVETRELVNKEPGLDLAAGIAGGMGLIAGGAFLVDSQSVYEADTTSKNYNEYGKGKAQLLGGVLAGVGAALLAIPLVDVARANGDEQVTTRFQEESGEPDLTRLRRCTDPANSGDLSKRLYLRFPNGARVKLGNTAADGALSTDLLDVLTANDFANGGMAAKASIAEDDDDEELGELDLTALGKRYDDLAWREVNADACRSTMDDSKCVEVSGYLKQRPTGIHAREAAEALAGHERTVREWRQKFGLGRSESDLVAGYRRMGFVPMPRMSKPGERVYYEPKRVCFLTFRGPQATGPARDISLSCLFQTSSEGITRVSAYYVLLLTLTSTEAWRAAVLDAFNHQLELRQSGELEISGMKMSLELAPLAVTMKLRSIE